MRYAIFLQGVKPQTPGELMDRLFISPSNTSHSICMLRKQVAKSNRDETNKNRTPFEIFIVFALTLIEHNVYQNYAAFTADFSTSRKFIIPNRFQARFATCVFARDMRAALVFLMLIRY